MTRVYTKLLWRELHWQRPFETGAVTELLTHLAALTPRSPVIYEARGSGGRIRYFIGAERTYMKKIEGVFTAHGDIRFTDPEEAARLPVTKAEQLKISKPTLSLNTELTESVVRAGLAALLATRGREQTALQIVLGASYAPAPMPHNVPDPHASWLKVAFGNVDPATAESRNMLREKIGTHGFSATVRLGATGTVITASAHIRNLLSALRTLQSAGVSITTVAEKAERVDTAHAPWHYPLRLSVKELSNLLLLPVGETAFPGVPNLHPKLLPAPKWYASPDQKHDRSFAATPDNGVRLSISPRDSLEHTVILGPTGSGKSTVMLNLILSDIRAGRSVLLIDPKADLAESVLARIPEERENDVVIIDPSESCPVGFNPLAYQDYHDPALLADAVLAVFQEVFKSNWGIRSQDILSAALLTLVRTKGASLLWLPPLLTDAAFRGKLTAKVKDDLALGSFWSAFESMRENERRQEIMPVLNKVRQFLLRPGLRNILGQSDPKFSLTELFEKPRIVLIPLNKGLIGSDSAKLLGSLIVGLTWTLALARAKTPEHLRHPVGVFIDELQDYISLPTDLSDALAQARGLGVGLTMAHQYRDQLPAALRAGIDANARNKIIFGLTASDARDMAAQAPELEAVDFMTLPRYHVYSSIMCGGKSTGWVSGATSPTSKAEHSTTLLRAKCRNRYGTPGAEVEREYRELLERCSQPEPAAAPPAIGRRETP